MMLNPGLSLNKASAELEVSPSLIGKWRKVNDKLLSHRLLNVCSVVPTPKSDLSDLEKITDGNFSLREQAIPTDVVTIQIEACV